MTFREALAVAKGITIKNPGLVGLFVRAYELPESESWRQFAMLMVDVGYEPPDRDDGRTVKISMRRGFTEPDLLGFGAQEGRAGDGDQGGDMNRRTAAGLHWVMTPAVIRSGVDLYDDVQYGRAARAVDGTIGIVARRLPEVVRVIVNGTVFVEAAEDVGQNWHAVVMAEGKIGGRRPGARGRRGIRTIPGARWLDNVAKGDIGRVDLGRKVRA